MTHVMTLQARKRLTVGAVVVLAVLAACTTGDAEDRDSATSLSQAK